MPINPVNSTKKEQTVHYTWKTLSIPDSKLKIVWTDAKTKRTSMGFEIADTSACSGIFYVPVQNVRRNADATGFLVQLPEKETQVAVRNSDGTKEKFIAPTLADLGYPISE